LVEMMKNMGTNANTTAEGNSGIVLESPVKDNGGGLVPIS